MCVCGVCVCVCTVCVCVCAGVCVHRLYITHPGLEIRAIWLSAGINTSRLIDEETAIGLGNPQFISHTNLKYVQLYHQHWVPLWWLFTSESRYGHVLQCSPSQDPILAGPHPGRTPSLPPSQCVSSYSQSSSNASSSTTDTSVHHSTHTHRVINCASKCMLMVMVVVRVLMYRFLLLSWEVNMMTTSSGLS